MSEAARTTTNGACFGLRNELGCLDAIHHKAQLVRLKNRFRDVVAPFAVVVFDWHTKVHLETQNIVVDCFGLGIYAL